MGQPANRVEQIRPNSNLVHFFLQYLLLGSSSVKNSGKDAHRKQEPSDKNDNTTPVHARSYLDTTRKLPHDNRMTTHATNNETGFIRQSKDRTDVVGLMYNVEIDLEQGFTIKENMIRHDSISSTHLYPTAIAWRDGNSPIPPNLSISNESTNVDKAK